MKKNLIDSALKYELMHLDEILKVLKDLKLVDKETYFGESAAWNWFYEKPSLSEKKKVLSALGYKF